MPPFPPKDDDDTEPAAPTLAPKSSSVIDLSNGIVLTRAERDGYHEAMDNLVAAVSAAEKRVAAQQAIAMARTIVDNALLASPIPAIAERLIMAIFDELIKEFEKEASR